MKIHSLYRSLSLPFLFAGAVLAVPLILWSAGEAHAQFVGAVDRIVDAADGDLTIPCYGEVEVDGWTANQRGHGVWSQVLTDDFTRWATAPVDIWLHIDAPVVDVDLCPSCLGSYTSPLLLARPDVEARFGRSDFRPSGYLARANVADGGGRGGACRVGPHDVYTAAIWRWNPRPILQYDMPSRRVTIVRNDTADHPGVPSGLDQSLGLDNFYDNSFSWGSSWSGDTTDYVNNYTKLSLASWSRSPLCAEAPGKDAVWKFTLIERKHVEISTKGSAFDTVLYVIKGDGRANPLVGCNDDVSPGQRHSEVSMDLDPGIYWVVLDGYSSASYGAFTINFKWKKL